MKKINQSINRSINQSINKTINGPINGSINQSIDQQNNKSYLQSINQWSAVRINIGIVLVRRETTPKLTSPHRPTPSLSESFLPADKSRMHRLTARLLFSGVRFSSSISVHPSERTENLFGWKNLKKNLFLKTLLATWLQIKIPSKQSIKGTVHLNNTSTIRERSQITPYLSSSAVEVAEDASETLGDSGITGKSKTWRGENIWNSFSWHFRQNFFHKAKYGSVELS